MIDISTIVSGAAGQGIHTIGYMLAKTASEAGYHVFSWQEYESRIRGGSNSYRIRISDKPVNAPLGKADIFMSLDRESKAKHLPLLKTDGILVDEEERGERVITVPFSAIAQRDFGNKLFANTVAVGALTAVLGIELASLKKVISHEFAGKGGEIVSKNLSAAAEGYKLAKRDCEGRCPWTLTKREQRYYLISGNEALALGASAAGCRFMVAYPMTPSTGIITFLSKHKDELKIFTEQAEDEIAAVNMAIGASYAGARAMTASSGGGFALMVEGISLAGMTETPLVIILAQRPAPATGLPTRTEQGDLLFAINAGHGEFPKIVFAPSDPKDAFHKIVRAFNLADKYQTPAIIMTDQFLADSYFTVENFELDKMVSKSCLVNPDKIQNYKRFQLNDTGISPRLFPGQSQHLVCCDSDEHDEYGHITEDLELRKRMVEKRLKKYELLRKEMRPPEEYHISDAGAIFVSWGSSRNAVLEVVDVLRENGAKVGAIHFTELWPLPEYEFPPEKNYYTVESNATGQLGKLLRSDYGVKVKGTINRYDGLPLDQEYIRERFENG
ncbi:2-oxoacid:acceptor oxidoreductase subunit alpha [candidate division KSB1 bacterium]|nr:2-oxoacid:acceptor oxidoreductase subunit alpha [candidate division KSB1 bacterium]